jgi:hypothetical protein
MIKKIIKIACCFFIAFFMCGCIGNDNTNNPDDNIISTENIVTYSYHISIYLNRTSEYNLYLPIPKTFGNSLLTCLVSNSSLPNTITLINTEKGFAAKVKINNSFQLSSNFTGNWKDYYKKGFNDGINLTLFADLTHYENKHPHYWIYCSNISNNDDVFIEISYNYKTTGGNVEGINCSKTRLLNEWNKIETDWYEISP